MRAVEFAITGLTEERRGRRRDRRRGSAALVAILIGSLVVLAQQAKRIPEADGGLNGQALGTAVLTGTGINTTVPKAVRPLPSMSAFGEQVVGTISAFKAFRITSTGSQSIDPKATLSAGEAGQFELEDRCRALKPHESCVISVRFHPQQRGKQSVQLVVTDAGGQDLARVLLTGTGVPPPEQPQTVPRLVVSVSHLTFDPQSVGTSSTPQKVTLSNRGGVDLKISYAPLESAEQRQFHLQSLCSNYYLPVGKDCTEEVQFQPRTEGAHAATFTITGTTQPAGDNSGALSSFSVEGTGTTARAQVDPSELNFNQDVKEQLPITVRSQGSAPLSISDVTVDGLDTARFRPDKTDCLKAPISSGAQCQIMVTHQPDSKTSHSARLVIGYSGSSTPTTVPLSWTQPPRAKLTANPDHLVFAPGAPNSQSITITNSGQGASGPLFAAVKSKAFRVAGNECSRALEPGGTCSVTVQYTAEPIPNEVISGVRESKARTPQDATLYIVEGLLRQTITVSLHGD